MDIDHKTLEPLIKAINRKTDENLRLDMSSKQRSHTKSLRKYGDIFPVALALQFLPCDDNLINVLLTCRRWNSSFKNKIQKHVLSAPIIQISTARRVAIWKQKLDYVKLLLVIIIDLCCWLGKI